MEEPQLSKEPNSRPASQKPKQENTFLNLGFNLVLPILFLSKGKGWFGPQIAKVFPNVDLGVLLIAMAFPIAYFVYDYIQRRKINWLSILGLVSVLLTGGIGVLSIPTKWFAVKEAAIPALLGIAILASLAFRKPLIEALLFNPELMEVEKVRERLRERSNELGFRRLLIQCTCLVALSFFVSALLNYFLARGMVVSPSGTDAFNQEVARMMKYSIFVITVPAMVIMGLAFYRLIAGLRKLTGYRLEEILVSRD